jgi:hypothetical protein
MSDHPQEKCPFVQGCPVFKYFKSYAIQVYMDAYCLGQYLTCERHKLRTSGQPVPADLLPMGARLLPNR